MVVCIKHWPENFRVIRKKGHDLPRDPPSNFDTPQSFRRQSDINVKDRNVESRKISIEARQSTSKEVEESIELDDIDDDLITDWDSLQCFCVKRNFTIDLCNIGF